MNKRERTDLARELLRDIASLKGEAEYHRENFTHRDVIAWAESTLANAATEYGISIDPMHAVTTSPDGREA